MKVTLHRRRGGVEGIYRCVISDSTNVTQTIYIGLYTACTGGRHLLYTSVCIPTHTPHQLLVMQLKSEEKPGWVTSLYIGKTHHCLYANINFVVLLCCVFG